MQFIGGIIVGSIIGFIIGVTCCKDDREDRKEKIADMKEGDFVSH